MSRTTGINTDERSEFGYILAGDFLLNELGRLEWELSFPELERIRAAARRLGCSRIFYDAKTVTMV